VGTKVRKERFSYSFAFLVSRAFVAIKNKSFLLKYFSLLTVFLHETNLIAMTGKLLKPILFGIALGAFLYFMPFFFLRGFLFFLIIGGLIRLFWFRGHGHGWRYSGFHPAFTDTIRNMSPEEYEAFKKKFNYYHCTHDEVKRAAPMPNA
jgi:hypothetical protein